MRRIVVGCWLLVACAGSTSVAGDKKVSAAETKAPAEVVAQWKGGSLSADELAKELGDERSVNILDMLKGEMLSSQIARAQELAASFGAGSAWATSGDDVDAGARFEKYLSQAEKSDVDAQAILDMMYDNGWYVAENMAEAI